MSRSTRPAPVVRARSSQRPDRSSQSQLITALGFLPQGFSFTHLRGTMSTLPLRLESPERDSKLVNAAVRVGDVVHVGWRHADIMRSLDPPEYVKLDQQGFVDQHGNFYSRRVAAVVALRAKQITEMPNTLTSESLWENDGHPLPLPPKLPHCPSCRSRVDQADWQSAVAKKQCYKCSCGTDFGIRGARYL